MKMISLNLWFGGGDRTDLILDYLIKNQPDLIVLSEYQNNSNGKKIKETLKKYDFKLEESVNDYLGVLVASKRPFTIKETNSRWVEIELSENKLRVLGVYIPVKEGKEKKLFWRNILQYAKENNDERCIITGDFNSCLQDDSMGIPYSEKELKKLLNLRWIDSWARYKNDDSERYTWYYPKTESGFRLDYAFLSPKLSEQIKIINLSHDSKIREDKISDHSPIVMEFVV